METVTISRDIVLRLAGMGGGQLSQPLTALSAAFTAASAFRFEYQIVTQGQIHSSKSGRYHSMRC